MGWIHLTQRLQIFGINFCRQIMPLCIESSTVWMALTCVNGQNIMFTTGWILYPRISSKKLAIQYFITQLEVKSARGFKFASRQNTWVLQHGNTHTAPSLFLMVHSVFVPRGSSFSSHLLRMRIGRVFPLLSFYSQRQPVTKRHMQAIIQKFSMNFFHIGATTLTVLNPQRARGHSHSHLMLQSLTQIRRSEGPCFRSGLGLFFSCASFICVNAGQIIARLPCDVKVPTSGRTMFVVGFKHLKLSK